MTMNPYDASVMIQMRKPGKIACEVLDIVEAYLCNNQNVKSIDIEKLCVTEIQKRGGIPECIGKEHGYGGPAYAHASCISPNNLVCHGVPSDYILKEGDIVNVDIVVRYGDWLGDTSRTFAIGNISKEDQLLVQAAEEAMYAGMAVLQIGAGFNLIGSMIDKYIKIFNKVNKTQFGIVSDLCSHGISKQMHEEPNIHHTPNQTNHKLRIQPYKFFTVEPIISSRKITFYEDKQDGWSLYSKCGAKATQFEHTVCVDANNKLNIMTARDELHEESIRQKVDAVRRFIINPNSK